MHILFVTLTLPVPTSSSRVRPYNLIKSLAARHTISLLSLIQPDEYSLLPKLEPYCDRIELVPFAGFTERDPWRNRLSGWASLLFARRPRGVQIFPVASLWEPLRRLTDESQPDVVHLEHLSAAELVRATGDTPCVLGTQNIEFEVLQEQWRLAQNPVHWLRDYLAWKQMLAYERRWLRQFPVCLVVSDHDGRLLRRIAGESEPFLVANGVDCAAFAPHPDGPQRQSKKLLFFGTLNYQPNRDGIRQFCQVVWPLIREQEPAAELEIVGRDAPDDVRTLSGLPGVTVTGYVPDIRDKLWTATASIVPMQWGGGTRLKILEALAAGCPSVSTTIGAEGLDLRDQQEIIIADQPVQFAAAAVRLLRDPVQWRRISLAGQAVAAARYDWRIIGQAAETAYERAMTLAGLSAAAPAVTPLLPPH